MQRRVFATGLLALPLILSLSACGTNSTTTPLPNTPVPTQATGAAGQLAGIKTYLIDKLTNLDNGAANLSKVADQFYDMAKGVNFDYARLWSEHPADVTKTVQAARDAWILASPLYEQAEGIVAGTPSLADYDVIIDAGATGEQGGDNVAPYDLTLPDGRVLSKPGNLFGVTESTLWGTYKGYFVEDVKVDYDGNGKPDFGDSLPDASVLKAGAATLHKYTSELLAAAQAWQPSNEDAFTALVVMVPTMSEYFNSWKNSRFVTGAASTQRDFVVISRLADMVGILGGLQVIYSEVSPMVQESDAPADKQIAQGIADLKTFVQTVWDQEKVGKQFTPEEADQLGEEAENRATAIAGQISQVAAQLGIKIDE